MPDKFRARERYGEAFWRKHHEAWQQSALKREQHCVLTLGQCDRDAGRVGELPDLAVELPAGKPKAATLGIARRRRSSDIEPS